MNYFKKAAFALLTACMLTVGMAGSVFADTTIVYMTEQINNSGPGFGWKQNDDGTWKYIMDGGTNATGLQLIVDAWYCFDEAGTMLKGWQSPDGKLRYFAESATETHPEGAMYVGEFTPDGSAVDSEGVLIPKPATEATDGVSKVNPYGNYSCVEISLGEQTVYAYSGVQLMLVSPCVTGNVSLGDGTPAGNYAIYSKERGRTLRGTNHDGSQYASYVEYWMPFNGGIGMHDASWRSSYGGTIYQTSGSHGCVNMPKAKAAALYDLVYVGMPVIVHD